MARRGRCRRRGCAALVAAGAVLLGGTACSDDLDRAQGLGTTLVGVEGVDDARVLPATRSTDNLIEVTLDPDLDPAATLGTIRRVDSAADDAGLTTYVLELSRTITDDDVLVVDHAFARSPQAQRVVADWTRVVDALLGEVAYDFGPHRELIEVVSGGAIGHDVAEASRIGSGRGETTWRFVADASAFTVSGRITRRDVTLFNRVQRSVSSPVLPVPARRYEVQRRTGHVLLDLEVSLDGSEDPERITLGRWQASIRPLAAAAVTSTRYPGASRFVQLSAVTTTGRDTFAVWSSAGRPVRGRDRYFRGWDPWWFRLADDLR